MGTRRELTKEISPEAVEGVSNDFGKDGARPLTGSPGNKDGEETAQKFAQPYNHMDNELENDSSPRPGVGNDNKKEKQADITFGHPTLSHTSNPAGDNPMQTAPVQGARSYTGHATYNQLQGGPG